MSEILFFDTETTGLPDWKSPSGGESQPHLVQLAAVLANETTGQVTQSIDVIIKPDGWEIPVETSDIHGITTEMAMDTGIPEKIALDIFLELWGSRKRVAHNTTFDNRIIRIATKRYSDEETIDAWKAGKYECTCWKSKPIMKLPNVGRGGYKLPKLEEAYFHFTGKGLVDAHTALADTMACKDIYFALKELEKKESAA